MVLNAIYLTGNPQMSYFKVVYHRHTNFSMESIKQVFDGTTDFGRNVVATISATCDLVGRMYLGICASFVQNKALNPSEPLNARKFIN